MLVCSKCWEINCTRHSQEYNRLIEIDDNIADIIIDLNKKGYKTNFCCGGHLSSLDELREGNCMPRIYIMFNTYAIKKKFDPRTFNPNVIGENWEWYYTNCTLSYGICDIRKYFIYEDCLNKIPKTKIKYVATQEIADKFIQELEDKRGELRAWVQTL